MFETLDTLHDVSGKLELSKSILSLSALIKGVMSKSVRGNVTSVHNLFLLTEVY